MNVFDLNSAYEEKLGIKRERLIEHARLVHLMAWEQVFLLCWYARSQYLTKNASHFHAKMMFLNLIRVRSNSDAILQLVTPILDEGAGFYQISEALREVDDEPLKSSISRLLSECEEEQIIFSSTEPPLYSHLAMKRALEDLIDILQELISTPKLDLLVDSITARVLQENAPHLAAMEFWKSSESKGFWKALMDRNSRSNLERYLENSKKNEQLGVMVSQALDKFLGERMRKVFEKIHHPLKGFKEDRVGKAKKDRRLCEILTNQTKRELTLCFDKEYLLSCFSMGQEDVVLENIASQIKSSLGKELLGNRRRVNSTVPVSLSRWYRSCAVIGLKKEPSIPSKIAALIDFDVRHAEYGFGFCHEKFRKIWRKKISASESSLITTGIIDHCLYHNRPLEEIVDYNFMLTDPQIELDKILSPAPAGAQILGSIMKDWSDRDLKKMKDRFKRPRVQVEKDIYESDSYIKKQILKGMGNKYPVEGDYPLPLWNSFWKIAD